MFKTKLICEILTGSVDDKIFWMQLSHNTSREWIVLLLSFDNLNDAQI